MPKVDGFEVLERMGRTASCRDLVVFVVRGRDDPKQVERAMRAGAARFVPKPLELEKLADVVELAARVLSQMGRRGSSARWRKNI